MRLFAGVSHLTLGLISLAGISAAIAVPIPPNVPVTGILPGLQNEEQVFICPTDTSVVVANHRDFRLGYRQIGIGRSTNGGASWVDSLLRPAFQLEQYQSDPVMTVSSSGTYYMCDLDYVPTSTYTDPSWVVFYRSTNKGATWTGPYTVETTTGPYFEDKQFITCDRTGGIHDGNVYVSWTRFAWPTRIMFARSTTGTTSFDDTLIVGPVHYVTCYGQYLDAGQFSQPLVGKDGAVYVFWQGYDVDSSGGNCDFNAGLRINKSTNGGVTWQGERLIGRVDGWNGVDGGVDVYSQPTTEADLTAGPHAGNLYLQYRDTSTTGGFLQSDIVCRRSLDTGHTWSPPLRVNDDPSGLDVDQFHNWLVCNDEGVLVSIWYDQRTDPAHYKFDVFAGYSYDGGATWTSNHRVSSVSISPSFLAAQAAKTTPEHTYGASKIPFQAMMPMAGKIAEYIGVSCVHDKIVAVWTDTRNSTGVGQQDVYSANWYLPLTDPRLIYPLNGETVGLTPGLLWATAWKESLDRYRLQIAPNSGFSSVLRDVMVTTNSFNDALTGLPDGLYYWRIKAYKAPGGIPSDSTAFSSPGSFQLQGAVCDCSCHGDPICDHAADVFDVINTIDIVFSGASNVIDPTCPHVGRGDYNCDCVLDVFDVIFAIDYIFSGGPVPCDPCAPGKQCP